MRPELPVWSEVGPSMISYELKCIFVHIQKTGGHSILQSLGLEIADKHRFARELKQKYDPEHWERYLKFAFVRNPWDRLVSWYAMMEARRGNQGRNKFARYVVSTANTFEEFIFRCTGTVHDHDGVKCIYTNQIDYITDVEGGLLVDYVGRFERLQTDFDHVCSLLRIDERRLPREAHGSVHAHYSTYYTDEMRDFVAERYKRDIDHFGYTFEPELPTRR